MTQSSRKYVSSPTLFKFHVSDAPVRGVMGPIGSGKSVACCVELVRRAHAQAPGPDGIRRSRWCVVRATFRELFDTTIKTFLDWFPDGVAGSFVKSPTPAFYYKSGDVEAEFLFRSIEVEADTKKLLSLELTGGWVNEARELPKGVVDALFSRCGRYPSKMQGGPTWSGVILDYNPPDDDSYLYRLAEEETPDGWEFFSQPGAIVLTDSGWAPNPAAENVQHHALGYQYWLRQTGGKSREWIKVYLCGEYGHLTDGRPVYPEYSDQVHCAAEPLKPHTNLPLILGFDFGLTPACVICQQTPRGQFKVLDEVVSHDQGIRQFLRDSLKPFLAEHYPGAQIVAVGDPAGAGRSQVDERTCFDEIRAAGIQIRPAKTNAFLARREAVAGYMVRMIDGEPGFQISPTCKLLRKGFLGGYCFERVRAAGERYKDQPVKDHHSHVQDSLQYACLYLERDTPEMAARQKPRANFQPKPWR